MFDIHYHLIFGVDDGPRSIEDSLELAEASIAEGVTHIVATPHASDKYSYQLEVNRERLAELNDRLGGRLTLGLGCDFHLSYDNLGQIEKDKSKFTINGSNYLLVEFPEFVNVATFSEVLFRLMVLGITPIITHPERNPTFLHNPAAIAEWVRTGCLVQVTAASLTGRFGKGCEALTRSLLKGNYVHFMASDAHNISHRAPAMGIGYETLKRDFGQETAERLCIHNPRAVFFGEPVPAQPEQTRLEYEKKPPPNKGFFRRLFG
jgi:protein-tyrosine phosphatase